MDRSSASMRNVRQRHRSGAALRRPRGPAGAAPVRVTIHEPNGGGHRFEFVRQVADALLRHGCEVLVDTTPVALGRPEYEQHLAPVAHEISLVADARARRPRRRPHARADALIDLEADRRLAPLAATHLARLCRRRTVALVMRPPWRERMPLDVRIKALLCAVVSRLPNFRLLVLGDCFGELAPPPGSGRVRVVADKPVLHAPVPPPGTPPPGAGSPPDVLVAGVLDERKHVAAWIDAAASGGFVLRLVGRAGERTREAVRSRQPGARVEMRDGFVTDVELDAAVASAGVVSVVLNTAVGSSGLLGRALSYGVPVVAGGNATVVAAVQRRGVGVVASDTSASGLRAALEVLLADYGSYRARAAAAASEIAAAPGVGDAVAAATLASRGRS